MTKKKVSKPKKATPTPTPTGKEGIHRVNPNIKEPIDILVPAHGRLDLTIGCIRAIYTNTISPFHLIVVDDSTEDMDDGMDMTKLYMERLQSKYDNVTYIHSDVPYENGNQIFNIGFKATKYDFMATVMNSMMVEPDWEIVAVQFMRQNPKVGVIGFKCLFPSGIIESAGIRMMGYTPVDVGRDFPGHRLSAIYETPAAQWAFALVRKEAGQNLEEDVYNGFKGWDDIDNCFVVRKRGYTIYYCGLGVGYHEPRATRGRNDIDSHFQNLQNGEAFYKRWGYWDMFKKWTGRPPDWEGITKEEVHASAMPMDERAKPPIPIVEGK